MRARAAAAARAQRCEAAVADHAPIAVAGGDHEAVGTQHRVERRRLDRLAPGRARLAAGDLVERGVVEGDDLGAAVVVVAAAVAEQAGECFEVDAALAGADQGVGGEGVGSATTLAARGMGRLRRVGWAG